MAGEDRLYHIKTGDCVLLPGGRSFVLTNNVSAKKRTKVNPDELLKTLSHGVMTIHGGGECLSIGTQF